MIINVLSDTANELIFQEIPEEDTPLQQWLKFVKLELILWIVSLTFFVIFALFYPRLGLYNLLAIWFFINLLQSMMLLGIFFAFLLINKLAEKYPPEYVCWEFNFLTDKITISHKENWQENQDVELRLSEFMKSMVTESPQNASLSILNFITNSGDIIEIEESSNQKKLIEISALINRFYSRIEEQEVNERSQVVDH